MSSAATISAASAPTDLPVALRIRQDLIIRPQTYRGRRFWCVKDPVSLAYFHLRDEEYEILRHLDGRTTLGELLATFRRRFPELSLDVEHLRGFLGGLYGNGLVTGETHGQGSRLWDRRTTNSRRAWLRALPGLLAIRFRGIDPGGLLRWLYDLLWWVFSPWTLGAIAVAVLSALSIVVTQFDQLAASLPRMDTFFTSRDVVLFFLALGGIKVLHEIGHGLTCLRFGGECHEMGVMLLVFAPCLYCDVSDSWLFPQKWRRIAVAAAGIAVELTLAAAATFGWWLSEPGLFQALFLNVMLICSVNTLLFNGNPLLRYDGYFVLSDLIEIPNLAAEARAALTRAFFGRDSSDPGWNRRELTLLAYGLASAVYRVFVTAAIAWFCLKMLTPIGLAPLAWMLAAVCAFGLVVGPATAIVSATTGPRPRKLRALATLFVLAIVLVAVAMIPLPHRIKAPTLLRPRDAARVYVSVGGTLVDAAASGQSVEAGEIIGRLDNASLEREVVDLETRLAELSAQRATLESRRLNDASLAAQIPATIEAAEAAASQLERRRRDLADLNLVTSRTGTILPPPLHSVPDSDDELPGWSGTPLDKQNRGCYLEPGTLFCLIGDPHRIEAALFVEEGSVGYLRAGQPVSLQFDQTHGKTIEGVVEDVATDPLRTAPPELASGGVLAVQQGPDGLVRPTETIYEVRVRLDDAAASRMLIRGLGRGKISVGEDRLADRVYRFLRRTFRFEL